MHYTLLLREQYPGKTVRHLGFKFQTQEPVDFHVDRLLGNYENKHGPRTVTNRTRMADSVNIHCQFQDGMVVEVLDLDRVSALEYAEYHCPTLLPEASAPNLTPT